MSELPTVPWGSLAALDRPRGWCGGWAHYSADVVQSALHSWRHLPGRPTMARQDLPPLECRGKGGLDQPSGKGERGEGGSYQLAGGRQSGAGGAESATFLRSSITIPSVDQLVCVCATCQLLPTTEHNACTTSTIPVATSGPDRPTNFEHFVLLLTAL